MHPQEHRVREVAYHIWESEGRPHGQDARHWEMACRLASDQPRLDTGLQTAAKKTKSAEPGELKTKPAKAQKATKVAKAAAADELPKAEKPRKATKSAKALAADASQAKSDPAKLNAKDDDKASAKADDKPNDKPKKSRKKTATSEPLAEDTSA